MQVIGWLIKKQGKPCAVGFSNRLTERLQIWTYSRKLLLKVEKSRIYSYLKASTGSRLDALTAG